MNTAWSLSILVIKQFLQVYKKWHQLAFFEFRNLVLPNFAQLMWVFGVLPNPVLTGVLTMVKTTLVKVANPG